MHQTPKMREHGVLMAYFLCVLAKDSVSAAKSKVLLVSMDGFRHDYLSKTETPNFDSMIATGVTVPYVNISFITDTFPSHYTIATGLFSESHGIVGNKMYDPLYDSTFTKRSTEPRWWEGGEPIWITATKANLRAGVYFWPGSEVAIQGIRPAIWHPYKEKVPFEEKVRAVVTWLSKDDFDLAVTYFHEPDSSGHSWGPDHEKMVPVIRRMDRLIGFLMQELEKARLTDKVNLIVTSDHGMTKVDLVNKVVDVFDYVNSSLLHSMVTEGTTAQIRPHPGKAAELVKALSSIKHIHVMLKDDIPQRFHLKNNRRVMDVFAYGDEGWLIGRNVSKYQNYLDTYRGDHGYDNTLDSMKPIFIASGPAFKRGVSVEPIQSVDIYPLICLLLDIEPSPNNGSVTRAKSLLNDKFLIDASVMLDCSCVSVLLLALTCAFINLIICSY